jgi:hypothetical protein
MTKRKHEISCTSSKEVTTTWYSPISPASLHEVKWRWSFIKMSACDKAYERMIGDWNEARLSGVNISRTNWVASIERFAKRADLFISQSFDTKLVLAVCTNTQRAEVLKDVWLERDAQDVPKGRDKEGACGSSMFSKLHHIGAWDIVSLFLWQPQLPQREVSVYRLVYTENTSQARIMCEQTTQWLKTGALSVEMREVTPYDGHRFISAHRHLICGSEVRMRVQGSGTRSAFRIVSLTPLVMSYEAEMPPLIVSATSANAHNTLSFRGPSAVLHSDIATLTRVNREVAFLTRSTIKSQQSARLYAMDAPPPLSVSCAVLKRMSRTSMRCNFEEVHKLQETYHFTPRNIGVLSTVLCPTDVDKGGLYYAGCGLGREVLAMSMSNPRQQFFANDLPDSSISTSMSAIDHAAALRSRAVGFGLIVASQISVCAASMCSEFSATKQMATSVLYSTVTSLDILRDTLRRALFGGVTMICMLTHVARPNSTVAGPTFDAAVTASVGFAIGSHGIRSIRKTIATNIRGGGVVVYDFSRLPSCTLRLVVCGILAQSW